jgi:hypothetical protein
VKPDTSAAVLVLRAAPGTTVAAALADEADRLGLPLVSLLQLPVGHVAALRGGRRVGERLVRERSDERAARAAAVVAAIDGTGRRACDS